ncbi:hypothetical protein NM688_g822 [Phlebia brevispora]|uniref:Uncharacterized protein n=1 Tax=Phlebia brevispora TaxID=194682 RepID=A0ACC1TDC9_9APHY|nr:hypothetical protein NM688_g822 [Phlebia brevispora]
MASQLAYTPVEEIPKIHAELLSTFKSGKTKPIAYRKEQLAQLIYMIKDNEDRFFETLKADLGRPNFESEMLDTSITMSEAKYAYDNVEKWAKPERTPWDFNWFAMKPTIRKEPKGVVLLISPFNFPLFLGLAHMAGAIAAGNTVVLKPSELTPATAQLLAELFPKYLDPECYRLVNGDVPVVSKLLELPWNHILYTGNGRVAKIVLTAAAKTLSPVTTELGGKSPVIIDPRCDMKLAARRILWGKFSNAGQLCVAPDYALVPRAAQDAFLDACQEVYKSFYPVDPSSSDSFSRIVSEAHTKRIKRYIDETKGKVVVGGQADVEKRYIAPTIVKDVPLDDSLMEDEIFGPVLPVVPVNDVDEAIEFINSKDHPLALYIFSQDSSFKAKVANNTESGSVIANDVDIHVGTTDLPFGGTGPSGSGYLTGKYSFDTFTHLRGTLDNPWWVDAILLKGRYPPYTAAKTRTVRKAIAVSMPPRPGQKLGKRWGLWIVFALVSAISAILMKRQRQ